MPVNSTSVSHTLEKEDEGLSSTPKLEDKKRTGSDSLKETLKPIPPNMSFTIAPGGNRKKDSLQLGDTALLSINSPILNEYQTFGVLDKNDSQNAEIMTQHIEPQAPEQMMYPSQFFQINMFQPQINIISPKPAKERKKRTSNRKTNKLKLNSRNFAQQIISKKETLY